MKQFCISFLVVCLTVFAGDRLCAKFLWYNSAYSYSSNIRKLHYECTDISEDFLIFGSSKGNYHYVPSIIADSLNCSVFNVGWNGASIISHLYLLEQIIAVHIPKYICLDLISTDYSGDVVYKDVLQYAPCFGRVPEADTIFRKSNDYFPFHISHLYRYNANIQSYIHALFFHNQESDDNNGYVALDKTGNKLKLAKIGAVVGNDVKIGYLNQFIQLCQKHNIKLFFCISPAYSLADSKTYVIPKIIAKKYAIPVFDYHTSRLFHEKPEYFRDEVHLCGLGARCFSSIFVNEVKKYLLLESKNKVMNE